MLDEHNPLVQKYRMAGNIMAHGEDNVKIRLIGRRDKDVRQHNQPQTKFLHLSSVILILCLMKETSLCTKSMAS